MNKLTIFFTAILIVLIVQPITAQDSYTLEYKFEKGKIYRYKDVTSVDAIQEMMGREMKIKSESKSVTRIEVDEIQENGDISLIMSADSMVVSSSTPMGDTTIVLNDVIGKRSKVNKTKQGKILSRETIDTVKLMGRFTSNAQREGLTFPVFSDKAIKVGDSWESNIIDTVNQMGGNVVSNSEVIYVLEGKEQKNGTECLKITFSGKITIEGKGKMQGIELFIDGTGKNNGTFYFDPKTCLLIEMSTTMESEINMATTGEHQMIIPMTQTTKSIRTLLE